MRLNQITVGVSDIPRAVEFYRRFGLKQIVATDHYARFVCPDGDSTFSVIRVDQVKTGTTSVYFECDDLDARIAALKAANIEFDTEAENHPWLWREANLRDPDGNCIILFYAGENRINPPWRLADA